LVHVREFIFFLTIILDLLCFYLHPDLFGLNAMSVECSLSVGSVVFEEALESALLALLLLLPLLPPLAAFPEELFPVEEKVLTTRFPSWGRPTIRETNIFTQ
jgi:hypothetical protein